MKNSDLTAISPLDGRYRSKVDPLRELFRKHQVLEIRDRELEEQ